MMTNSWQTRGVSRKMSGSVASIGDRADFRNTSAGIATRFMLLLLVFLNSLLHPLLPSLLPAAAAPSLMGLGK
ncbi:hypothetical protein LN360_04350 [Escherichia coli]|nr:hypothetical protein [Escherichia coli]UEX60315.1 hypothetical protein LN360_04350 [Escherichia coli]